MTTFLAFVYVTMTILCVTGITLTVSEIQTIWLKYKRSKVQRETYAIDPLPILRAIKEEDK